MWIWKVRNAALAASQESHRVEKRGRRQGEDWWQSRAQRRAEGMRYRMDEIDRAVACSRHMGTVSRVWPAKYPCMHDSRSNLSEQKIFAQPL